VAARVRCAQAACATHVHASHHLLNPTVTTVAGRTLRQPHAYTSTNACEPACCIPQAIRPLRRRREAAAERRAAETMAETATAVAGRVVVAAARLRRPPWTAPPRRPT